MEIKTCEQYVLSELEALKRELLKAHEENDGLKQDIAVGNGVIGALKEIFYVEQDATTGILNIGVKEDVLDATKDAAAGSRLMLLMHLFSKEESGEDAAGDAGGDAAALAAEMEAAGVEKEPVEK